MEISDISLKLITSIIKYDVRIIYYPTFPEILINIDKMFFYVNCLFFRIKFSLFIKIAS